MPISDLTGTKWHSKATYTTTTFVVYDIEGEYLTQGYWTSIEGGLVLNGVFRGESEGYRSTYTNTLGYGNRMYATSPTEWEIEITGGSDVTNASLIAWLEENATQVVSATPSLNFGGSDVSLFLGSSYVSKVYLGNTLLYEAEIIPDNAIVTADNTYLVDTTGGYLLTTETTLISFTVGNTTYQAESGWDFATWIESEYNTAGYSADSNNKVIRATRPRGHVLYLQLNGDVYTTDTIVANGEYSEYML